ncbi:hypothetical protein HOLleu_38736 [Holothuria leucospilota]|uniref:Uncharacterized protein n=1 Tax=Holothuria leucospilota TaxID=206669 RepID=A0A9Q0YGD0_HOLLE|nr:hypothetical protein HOLleu_38736 [Holothuria leucospilota]
MRYIQPSFSRGSLSDQCGTAQQMCPETLDEKCSELMQNTAGKASGIRVMAKKLHCIAVYCYS